tara:strand:- start:22 stop:504 length:483 start_codon:yes stop_codon:yes gene_type:complete
MIEKKQGYPMKKNNKLKDVWSVYLVIAMLTILVAIGVATADEPPISRIIAEPEWLQQGEEDDGKYAMMINKGLLCDKDDVIMNRMTAKGYVRAFRGINESGNHTYILIKSNFTNGKYHMDKIAILELHTITQIMCLVSENIAPEYNQNYIYLELYPGEQL